MIILIVEQDLIEGSLMKDGLLKTGGLKRTGGWKMILILLEGPRLILPLLDQSLLSVHHFYLVLLLIYRE